MLDKSGSNEAPGRIAAWLAALRDELDSVRRDLALGDPVDAERRAKAVTAFVRAARDLAELEAQAAAAPKEKHVDDIIAELERRLAGFLAADRAGEISPLADAARSGGAAG